MADTNNTPTRRRSTPRHFGAQLVAGLAALSGSPVSPFALRPPGSSELLPSDQVRVRIARPKKKCLLPSCEVWTEHRGGYCCVEHCREHKALARAKA